jgi:tight adherence protein C
LAVPSLARLMPKDRKQIDDFLCRTGTRWSSEEQKTALGIKLEQAGLDISPEWFNGSRLLVSCGAGLLYLPLLLTGSDLFWLVFLVPLLYFLPGMWLNSKVANRKSAIRLSLSDFTVLLSTALAAGADISASLREAAAGTGGPLAQEIDRALKEYGAGRNITDALTDVAERCDVDELRGLVRTIVQAYRYGAPLAQTMRAHSEQMGTIKRFEMMEAANKLSVKLVIPVLLFMLVPCMIALGYPAMVSLLEAFA